MACTRTGDNMPWLHTSHIYTISQDALQLLSEDLTVVINYKAIVHGANNFWRRIWVKLNTVVSLAYIHGHQDEIPWRRQGKCYDGRYAFRKRPLIFTQLRIPFEDKKPVRTLTFLMQSRWHTGFSLSEITCISFQITLGLRVPSYALYLCHLQIHSDS